MEEGRARQEKGRNGRYEREREKGKEKCIVGLLWPMSSCLSLLSLPWREVSWLLALLKSTVLLTSLLSPWLGES